MVTCFLIFLRMLFHDHLYLLSSLFPNYMQRNTHSFPYIFCLFLICFQFLFDSMCSLCLMGVLVSIHLPICILFLTFSLFLLIGCHLYSLVICLFHLLQS